MPHSRLTRAAERVFDRLAVEPREFFRVARLHDVGRRH